MAAVPNESAIHDSLTAWFKKRIDKAQGLSLSPLKQPSTGFSNETYLCEVSFSLEGKARSEEVVVRLEPLGFQIFPEYDLSRQFRIMQCLSATDVPVPRVRWLEEDRSVLGKVFYVMDRVAGEVPSEIPLYHASGVCFDAGPAQRAGMWWSGVETLARIHSLDWERLGLSFLGVPSPGTGPIDRQLDYYERFLGWASRGRPQPILDAALRWLRSHTYKPARVSLCWGDCRLPNLIFRGGRVAGVLDWEMAFLGDPEADLAWWLFMDWHSSEAYGIPRLPGFPDRVETLHRYEELSGQTIKNLTYNEIFAAFRFGVIMLRVAVRMDETGVPMPPDFGSNNPATQRLAALLDLPLPGPPPGPAAGAGQDVITRLSPG